MWKQRAVSQAKYFINNSHHNNSISIFSSNSGDVKDLIKHGEYPDVMGTLAVST